MTNGVIKLRTLTFKSEIGFGENKYRKVGELIDNDQWNFLVGLYFTCNLISFTDDVLTRIHITDEFRIQKPGRAPEKIPAFWQHVKVINHQNYTDDQLMKAASHIRKIKRQNFKAISVSRKAADNFYNSRGQMAAKNQNRKKF